MNLYQQILHRSRYARWNEEEKMREDYPQTVERLLDFFDEHLSANHNYSFRQSPYFNEVRASLIDLGVMPSMRTLMTAGTALKSAHVANYNCAFLPCDSVRSFSEHMYVLMCGAGSGFSVERRFTEKLPEIPELHPSDTTVVFHDSRKGWCVGLNQFLNLLYAGNIPKADTSKIRKEGERLKTFGGYASGPGVLVELLEHIVKIFKAAQGRRLKPIEVFSIFAMIAQIVVVGGVRRSATICLFDKDDVEMRRAKSGQWWVENAHYAMANVSAVFETKPDALEFMDIWRDLIASGSGEPGMFNRAAVWEHNELIDRPTRDASGNRIMFGANPCCEILLKPYQFCNLTGVAIRPEDTLETLLKKTELATILGTIQSTITDFDYLRKVWKDNVEEERLLGVCLAGIMDHPVLKEVSDESAHWYNMMRAKVWEVNKEFAKVLGINPSASVTAIKPAGNSGELYDVASGIHPRYSPYYIRTVRQSASDPMTAFLQASGVPWEVSKQNARDIVFSFPMKSPEGAVFGNTMSAFEQLEHWLHVKRNYATHTVSCTIYVKKHEWMLVGAWVYGHFDDITGLSFLPYDDHTYEQAPYQPITEAEYLEKIKDMPTDIDWSLLKHFEATDTTTASQEFACVGNACVLP